MPMLFDDTCQQIHGGGGADSGYVVSLNEIDDVADSIEAFLNGIVYLVMHGTDMTGHFAGFNQVGSTLQADAKEWSCGHQASALLSVSMRLAAYFLAMAEMTEESSPPLSRTP